ncbi:MAG: HlyC/CorC family transporter [Solirubrobacterales bacterium]|nr:HlyC/CorC family transporter [Solirubrobacterales bacterium]MBV9471395.1 HlyC/CorC family transporter [Solirubrobacterales bacterium]
MKALFIILTALLVLVNAFFVIAEYALVRSRRARLEALADEGTRGARLALSQLEEIGDYIAACQVGITMASIGIGALGEPAIAHLLESAFGGALGHAAAVAISVIIAYLLIISAQSIGGEIVPKLYAIQHAEGVARRIARPMRFFRSLFHPFIVVLNASSNALLRLFGTDPDAEPEGGTPDELKRIIAESQTGGQLDVGEANMLTGVFHLHEQEARQVMTPIPAVVTVDVAETVEDALRRCVSTGHSRLVVTEDDNQDRVKGIVHVNQLVKLMMSHGEEANFAGLVREAPLVPETKPLDDLLADLQRERTELAIVIDEYGRTAGIVTIEDIIEEVVGEIADETDPAGGAVRRLANGDWFVRGHVAVSDLEDYGLELPVDTDAYNSVGGFVFAELGRLPKRGDTIAANGYSIRVESVRENRIEAVRIRQRRTAAERAASS